MLRREILLERPQPIVEGVWQSPGPVGNFSVSGTLGGKNVAALVPEA